MLKYYSYFSIFYFSLLFGMSEASLACQNRIFPVKIYNVPSILQIGINKNLSFTNIFLGSQYQPINNLGISSVMSPKITNEDNISFYCNIGISYKTNFKITNYSSNTLNINIHNYLSYNKSSQRWYSLSLSESFSFNSMDIHLGWNILFNNLWTRNLITGSSLINFNDTMKLVPGFSMFFSPQLDYLTSLSVILFL